jgi:hypothetical protein
MTSFQYPYPEPLKIPLYKDPYKRRVPRLLKSMAHYAYTHQHSDTRIPRRLKLMIVACTHFCDKPPPNPKQNPNTDLARFIECFPPPPIKGRTVLPINVLSNQLEYIAALIPPENEQVIIVQQFGDTECYSIFLILLTERRIEAFTVGDVEPVQIQGMLFQIENVITLVFPGIPVFESHHRLHVPITFTNDSHYCNGVYDDPLPTPTWTIFNTQSKESHAISMLSPFHTDPMPRSMAWPFGY